MHYITLPVCFVIGILCLLAVKQIDAEETEDQLEAANSEPHPLYKDK